MDLNQKLAARRLELAKEAELLNKAQLAKAATSSAAKAFEQKQQVEFATAARLEKDIEKKKEKSLRQAEIHAKINRASALRKAVEDRLSPGQKLARALISTLSVVAILFFNKTFGILLWLATMGYFYFLKSDIEKKIIAEEDILAASIESKKSTDNPNSI